MAAHPCKPSLLLHSEPSHRSHVVNHADNACSWEDCFLPDLSQNSIVQTGITGRQWWNCMGTITLIHCTFCICSSVGLVGIWCKGFPNHRGHNFSLRAGKVFLCHIMSDWDMLLWYAIEETASSHSPCGTPSMEDWNYDFRRHVSTAQFVCLKVPEGLH